MPDYSSVDQDLVANQQRFAGALKTWLDQNGLPQKITDDWAKDCGYPNGPWASQICNLLQGDFEPRSSFWIALQEFNLSVGLPEFSHIKDQKLKERLDGVEPFVDREGNIAMASTLFAMFIGQEAIPVKYTGITDKSAEQWCADVADRFEALVMDSAVPANLLWQKVEKELPLEPDPWTNTVKRVVLRLELLTGRETSQLLGAITLRSEQDPVWSALCKVERELEPPTLVSNRPR